MRSIRATIERIALSDLGVLIVGESGTEKELLAREIHTLSGRAEHQFVHLNCSSVSAGDALGIIFGSESLTLHGMDIERGVLEIARGGTIYFDGMSELEQSVQSKLCRVVEDHYFRRVGGFDVVGLNVRLIASVSRCSADSISSEETGSEFYYRMCPININLPPLRERREDIPLLIKQYILEDNKHLTCRPKGITGEALSLCVSYDWPGNALELKKAMEHALVACSEQFIRRNHLPNYLQELNQKSKLRLTTESIHTWRSVR